MELPARQHFPPSHPPGKAEAAGLLELTFAPLSLPRKPLWEERLLSPTPASLVVESLNLDGNSHVMWNKVSVQYSFSDHGFFI